MVEFVNGLNVSQLFNGGAIFEIKPNVEDLDVDNEEERAEYLKNVDEYTNFNFLNINDNEEFLNKEPFEALEQTMVNLTVDGKVKKKILQEGYGECPSDNTSVKLHYNAYVEYETVPFDSTYARKKPFVLQLNNEGLEGFQIAVKSMKINEKSLFLVHPDLAYKDSGLKRIPPNSTILFEIELLTIFIQHEQEVDNSWKTGYKICSTLSAKAKEEFIAKNYQSSLSTYGKALRKLENTVLEKDEEQKEYDEYLAKLHINMLVCCTLLKKPKLGCYHANFVFDLAKNGNIKVPAKVFFNKAKCLKMLNEHELALKLFKVALRMSPKDTYIKQSLQHLEDEMKKAKEKQIKMGKNLVQA